MRLAAITVFPLKSAAGIDVERWPLGATGLLDDRRLMLVDARGDFVTMRAHPRLVLVRTALVGRALRLERPGAAPLEVTMEPDPERDAETPRHEVQIWGDYVAASHVSAEADAWFSELVEKPVHLVRFDPPTERAVPLAYAQPGDRVHFADVFPVLVAGTASLDALNARLTTPVPMRRFRPNLVVATHTPFIEDTWRTIRIGEVALDLVKPCSRCVAVNVDPDTGVSAKETLAVLATFRTVGNKVLFGQNAIPRALGTLALGDAVEVVETQA